ncbi:MAG: succinate dehydrogenase, hydrophobic membrane anchor protein [Pseudomonadales bacterium]|nr:succinate dehydrogenase, hydrophobic membrane anchor protein [Pseudomonadales bacterium]
MVTSVTNLGKSGVSDWLLQRVTAVILAAYTVFIVGFLLLNPELTFTQWSGLFETTWVRIFSLLSLISLGAHAWVGLWTVSTDYIKPTGLRFLFQAVVVIGLFVYVVWGIQILWGA